jgi:hypothetical protein
MFNKVLLTTVILNLFFCASLFASDQKIPILCKTVKIRSQVDDRNYEQKRTLCFDRSHQILFSENCLSIQSCELDRRIRSHYNRGQAANIYNLDTHKPGVKVCNIIKGKIESIEYFDRGEWWKIEGCQVLDNNIIDLTTLYQRAQPDVVMRYFDSTNTN